MDKLPISHNEPARLQALKDYQILNSLSEKEYDRITALAAIICEVPIALIGLIDEDRQWFKSKIGIAGDQADRELTFCQYTILEDTLLEVPDATADARFKDNPFVQQDPHIRFYAGYPLIDPAGFKLGTLCVADHKPRQLSTQQKEALRLLSLEVMQLILERRAKEELRIFEKLFLLSPDLICVADTTGAFKKVNPSFQHILGWTTAEMLQKKLFDLIHPDELEATLGEMEKLKQGNAIINYEHRMLTSSGTYKLFQFVVSPELNTNNLFAIGRDVTALRANEDKLVEKEADLRAIVDNTQGLICTHNLDGTFIGVNSAGGMILGYTREELSQMSLFDVIPEERHPHLVAYLEHIRQHGSGSGQMLVIHKDGTLKTLLFNNQLEIRPGRAPYVIGNAMDITESRNMERRLYQLTEMLEQTNKVARVGGWQFDLATQVVYWTALTREIHDAAPDYEPVLETAIDFYKEGPQRQLIQQAIDAAIAYGTPWELEVQIVTLTGREVWVKSMGNANFENGVCKRLFGSFQDIDQQKKVEIEADRARAILRSFVNYTPAAVAMLDNNMNYIAVSTRWLEEYKINGKDIVGTSYYDYFPFITMEGRARHQRILAGAIEREEEDEFVGQGETLQGYITWEMRPWYVADGVIGGIMIFTQNISAAVQQRKDLDQAKVAAEQASIAKSDFLSNMSHEIRTPLNGVIGFTDLVLKTALNDTQLQYLSIVNQSANALLGIINDILDFSKIEAGKLELDIEECDIYEISGQATDIITYQVQKKGLEMLLNLAPDLPRFIHTDSVRLKQILVNLLGNAAKFTEQGEIELKISLLEQQDQQSLFRFSVRDTGIGIKADKKDKIFEAFAQEDASTTKKYGGTGLGLAITNKLLALMGSKLQLNTVLGQGSEFFFEVWMQAKQGDAKEWENISWIKKVLIVDDNANNRTILQDMLLLKNINSTLAKNGFEALQLLATGERFDVVLMDYHMPYLDGLDTIRQIRESFSNTDQVQPIVMLFSSADDEKVIRGCEELQVRSRLVKPVKMSDLYQLLSQVLLKDKAVALVPRNTQPGITDQALHILVADDNPINMLLAKTIINRAVPNAQVSEAKNGIEAVAKFKQQRPDLVLMDVQMPELNGYEATAAIRTLEGQNQRVPIIALTAGNVKNERERCVDAGMDDFVVKPVIEEIIVQILKKWLHIEEVPAVFSTGQTIDELEHFDPAILQSHIGHDALVMAEILALTKLQLQKSLTLLERAIQQDQPLAIAAEGHKLYGTAISTGLPRLAKLAREIELFKAAKRVNINDLYLSLCEEVKKCTALM